MLPLFFKTCGEEILDSLLGSAEKEEEECFRVNYMQLKGKDLKRHGVLQGFSVKARRMDGVLVLTASV